MKVYGFDESFNTCDCCGKSNLKGTFTVETEDGELLHYGSTCVTRHTGKPSRVVKSEAAQNTEIRRLAALKEVQAHPTYAALQARMDEAREAGLIARAFYEFCTEARNAQHVAQGEIAARTGFKFYQLNG